MSKNKGFTLVELLAVITLLGLIALITIPVVTNAMAKQKEKLYYDQLNQLIKAAQNWGTDNTDILRELPGVCVDSNWVQISLSMLKNGSSDVTYLDKDFINPKTSENFAENEIFVWVFKKNKSYLYCVDTKDCTNNKYIEHSEIASRICCNGDDFKARTAFESGSCLPTGLLNKNA